ncbi:malate/L-lactate dehydrogenase [Cupriavidus basilensis OR16]|uniref:Malate/L-lactate dehydrogenase n=1 Tax=Cupriavidus basilensis OR16 TaxID=1127483 RepID=H1SC18_9BURK|nr:Ldh family oxidoreductase [Cupriavidus basilensis]EHP39938.1 malate/L-lactate dehydrogenase [Cupriavidus basilensis OR16]
MQTELNTGRYGHDALLAFVEGLFHKAGAQAELASVVARTLVEGDLLGHSTHGTNLVNGYLGSILDGHAIVDTTQFRTLSQSASSALFDGSYVLGPYCVSRALDFACEVAASHGIGIAVVRRSHHIGCLAAYLQRVTDRGLVPLIYSSDPSVASVSAHGGIEPLFTPNPIAVGIPTRQAPMLIDVSMSTITNGFVNKTRNAGEKLPQPVLMSNQGVLTDDPEAFFSTPPGSILPLGGREFGHKGFALGLMVEALTSGLAGHGRKDKPDAWGASVCTMAIDPAFFGGIESFTEESSHLADQVRASTPVEAGRPVRLPGAAGLALREAQLRDGVNLPGFVVASLQAAAQRMGVKEFPATLSR